MFPHTEMTLPLQYKLDFHVDPSGMSMDLVVSLPIMVRPPSMLL